MLEEDNWPMAPEAFATQVREALTHLHNRSYLESLPLAGLLGDDRQALGGDALRRLLIEAIERLKPVQSTPATLADWRRYRQIVLRYVEGYSRDQVARDLMVSVRQASRDHEQAIKALTTILQADWPRGRSGHAPDPPGLTLARSTRDRSRRGRVTLVDPLEGDADLAETLRAALATLKGLLAERKTRVVVSLPDILPSVAISQSLLRQALLHLLSYAAESARRMTVSLTAADVAEGIVLRVEIPGDPEQPNIPDRSVAELTKARDLLETGCRILAARGIVAQIEGGADDPRSVTIALPPSRQSTVLVVDDNPDVVALFRRYLRGEPYRLIQATSGASALRVAPDLRPELIILDVMLPSQDGWDVLNELRATPALKDTPVIVCSVLPEQTLAEELGVSDFLPKPVTRLSLRLVLDRWCSASKVHPARL